MADTSRPRQSVQKTKMDSQTKEVKRQMKELQILETELGSLKKGAAVYRQQPNSNLYFKDDREKVAADTRRQLSKLVNE